MNNPKVTYKVLHQAYSGKQKGTPLSCLYCISYKKRASLRTSAACELATLPHLQRGEHSLHCQHFSSAVIRNVTADPEFPLGRDFLSQSIFLCILRRSMNSKMTIKSSKSNYPTSICGYQIINQIPLQFSHYFTQPGTQRIFIKMKSQVLIGKTSGQNVSFIFPLGRTFKPIVWLKCQSGCCASAGTLDELCILENHQAILAWQEIKILSCISYFLKYPFRIKDQITKYVYNIFSSIPES